MCSSKATSAKLEAVRRRPHFQVHARIVGAFTAEKLAPIRLLSHSPRPDFEEAWSRPLPAEVDSRGVLTFCALGGIQRHERFCSPRRPARLAGLCVARAHSARGPPHPTPAIRPRLDAPDRHRLQRLRCRIGRRVGVSGHSCSRLDGGRAPGPAPAVATRRQCRQADCRAGGHVACSKEG